MTPPLPTGMHKPHPVGAAGPRVNCTVRNRTTVTSAGHILVERASQINMHFVGNVN